MLELQGPRRPRHPSNLCDLDLDELVYNRETTASVDGVPM
jgi:hypothetical protein